MNLKRMCINQPSTLQSQHLLHGVRVLAEMTPGDGSVRVWFTEGRYISMEISRAALSEGWREEEDKPRIFCPDPRHGTPCTYEDCPACKEECEPPKQDGKIDFSKALPAIKAEEQKGPVPPQRIGEPWPPKREKTLEHLLEEISVHDPGQWENELSKDSIVQDWWAVSSDDAGGIVAYFGREVDAYRFRLDYINRKLNP